MHSQFVISSIAWVLCQSSASIAAGADVQGGLVFAHAKQLLSCLGSAAITAEQGLVALGLVDCDDPTALWNRTLQDIRIPGLLPQLPTPSGSRLSGASLCALPSIAPESDRGGLNLSLTPSLASDACAQGWFWHLDEDSRLHVTPSPLGDAPMVGLPGDLCLQWTLATGPALSLESCSEDTGQKWLALPRGLQDRNARLREVGFPLRVQGRRIVDAAGRRVRLRGVNWYGAHMEMRVNNGLARQPLSTIVRLIRHLGFNSVRMNYAVNMWYDNSTVDPIFLAANPQLFNMTALEVFDHVIEALTQAGLLVIINCHTSDYRWCCSLHDDQSLWYNGRWTEQNWLDSLSGLARRYSGNPRVIGFDPRNEPRPLVPDGSTDPILLWWGTKAFGECQGVAVQDESGREVQVGLFSNRGICLEQHAADWRAAATQAAYAVWHGNPDALLFVEGLGGAELAPTSASPMPFVQDCLHSRVVWSVHDYNWFWRWLRLGDALTRGASSFADLFRTLASVYKNEPDPGEAPVERSYAEFAKNRQASWAFYLAEDRAPVWVGEFGTGDNTTWWRHFLQHAAEMDLDWAYWSLDGTKYPAGAIVDPSYMDSAQKLDVPSGERLLEDAPDGYGLLGTDYISAQQVWKLADLVSIQAPVLAEEPSPSPAPAACSFDQALQPVVGTGPHPRGFQGYLDWAPLSCGPQEPAGRRLGPGAAAGNDSAARGSVAPAATPDEVGQSGLAPVLLAQLGSSYRQAACSGMLAGSPDALSEEDRRAARRQLLAVAGQPNPTDVALREANSPEEAQANIQQLVDEKMVSLEVLFGLLGAALPILLATMCVWASTSLRPNRSGWSSPRSYANRRVQACCRSRKWQPPMALSAITEATRSWRQLVAVGYACVGGGIVALALLCLVSASRAHRGLRSTRCAVARGLDEVFNGAHTDSGSFAGLLPALTAVDELLAVLDNNSPTSQLTARLLREMRNVSTVLPQLQLLTKAMADRATEGPCAAFDGRLVGAVRRKVDWGLARTVEIVSEQAAVLRPQIENVLGSFQDHLDGARAPLRQALDFVIAESTSLWQSDPLAAVESQVNSAIVVLLSMFVFIVPTLAAGLAALIWFCRDASPRRAGSAAEEGGRGAPTDDTRDGGSRPLAFSRPRSAMVAWMLGLLYGLATLGLGAWLRSTTSAAAGVCMVLDDLSTARLRSYSAAFGVRLPGTGVLSEAAMDLVVGCLATDASPQGSLGGILRVSTCPAGSTQPVIMSFADLLRLVDRTSASQLERVKKLVDSQGKLAQDPDVETLLAALRVAGPAIGSAVGCDSMGLEQCAATRAALAEACSIALGETACNYYVNLTGGCDVAPAFEARRSTFQGALRDLFLQRAGAVDRAVARVAETVLVDLWGEVSNHTLVRTAALVDQLDCAVVRDAVSRVVDSACFQLADELLRVGDVLLSLGVLTLLMAMMMYLLWLRITQFLALAAAHHEAEQQAKSGGLPLNLSALSRRVALGCWRPSPALFRGRTEVAVAIAVVGAPSESNRSGCTCRSSSRTSPTVSVTPLSRLAGSPRSSARRRLRGALRSSEGDAEAEAVEEQMRSAEDHAAGIRLEMPA